MHKKLIALWFVLSLGLIAVTELIAYRNMVGLVETGEQVNQTLEILSDINDLQSHILEAENAKRGFVITGKPLHLSRFTIATQQIQDLMVQLRTLTRNDPVQQKRLEHIAPRIDKKIAHLNQTISLRRQKGFDLDEQISLTDAGKALQDDIQQLLDDLAQAEKQKLWQRSVERRSSTQRSLLDLALGTCLSFGILSLVFWYLNREISGRTQAEASLRRANRTLKTLIEGNQAMIRAAAEDSLLQEICRILVAEGGYRLAWVGLAVADQEKSVHPLARYGVDDGYLETLNLTWADTERGRGFFGKALRTGQPSIIRSIREDQSFAPWRAEALKRGFASACAFPLKIDGQPWGALGIYAGEPNVFDAEEVKLLAELARHLEYGLEVLRDRTGHQRVAKALEESEAQYRLLVDNLNQGLSIINPQGIITFVNPGLCELLGYSRGEIIGRKVFDFLDQSNQEILRDQLNRRQRGETTPYEIEWIRKDGEKIIALITPMPIFDDEGRFQSAFAVITDITDRKQAEAQAQEHLHSLNLLIAGVGKLAKLRDPDAMVQEICQLVVDAFDTRLVWLGRVESKGCIRPLYWAGEMADCLKEMKICLDDPTASQGPVGQAIKAGKPKLINDMGREAAGTPWVVAARDRGYQSLATFPLMSGLQAFACLNIYSDRPNFFTPERVDLLQAFAGIGAAAVDNATLVNELQRSHVELTLAYEATLEGWAKALELRDFETKGHSQRVTTLTLKLARTLGVEDQDLTPIYRGALLHDIGKIAVPDSILLKPGPLNPEEWVLMRQHPIYAYELLSPITYLRPALDIPFCHHERWNGSGYPRGLKGEEIPLPARIFAVVDVWDALSSARPYRPAWPQDRVRAYLQEQAGVRLDPTVVEVFLEKFLARNETAA